jgi:hypothetical protein
MTAHNYAVEHSNLEMLELLETYGAKINVPRLGLNDALGALDMTVAIWLTDKGSRLQGWEGELSPLECLFKSNPTSETDRENFQQLLDKLLAAGAKPEGQLLSGCGPKTTAKLLKAGADASVRDAHGKTALFYANSADSIHLLVNAGLNLEELASKLIGGKAMTPLQTVLTLNDHLNPIHRATQFIEAGANPLTPDNQGYNALWHCRWADCAALIVAQGLDPKAHDGQGCTLLHRMFQQMGTVMLERDVPLLAFWLSLGVDVHHINHLGNTVLHAAALASKHYWGCDDGDLCVLIEKLLTQGVDKSVKNLEGKTAVQLLKKSFKKCHVALK